MRETTYQLMQTAKLDPKRTEELIRQANWIEKPFWWDAYERVASATRLPPQLIAAIHYREGNNDLRRSISDGHKLKETENWIDDAKHQIGMHRPGNQPTDTLIQQLIWAEKWNGLGYEKMGTNSPYVWAGTNHYKGGKYVEDGRYDAKATDKQLGVYAILRALGMTKQGETAMTPQTQQTATAPATQSQNSVSISNIWNTLGIFTDILQTAEGAAERLAPPAWKPIISTAQSITATAAQLTAVLHQGNQDRNTVFSSLDALTHMIDEIRAAVNSRTPPAA